MSALGFREPNEVLWRGIRPAHKGTQVAADAGTANATIVLHTVTASKTFFLTGAVFHYDGTTIGHRARLMVRNIANAIQYTIFTSLTGVAGHGDVSKSFWPPLEIPAGWDIAADSNAITLVVTAFIHGWEE